MELKKKKYKIRIEKEFEAFDIIQARMIAREYVKNNFHDRNDVTCKLQELCDTGPPKGEILKLE